MDLHTPLDPVQFGHLRVSTMRRTERTTPYLCCVCHTREMGMRGHRPEWVCDNPACKAEAIRLDWLVI